MEGNEGNEGNWGRWGDDDERGTLNHIDAAAVVAAAALVRRGRVYSLALPIAEGSTPPVGIRPLPQRLTLTAPADAEQFASWGAAPGVGSNEDLLVLASHSMTHMDALSHVFADGSMYNGFPADSYKPATGASRCDIASLGAFAGRGVLLDLAAHAGMDCLELGHVVTGDELAACAAAQGTEVRTGDVVLVRTGYVERWLNRGRDKLGFAQPGLGLSTVDFLRDHEVAACGADNSAVEAIPFDEGIYTGVHLQLVRLLGMPLMEHLALGALAADGVHEFLFAVGPLPVPGAAGSPINPIAIA